MTSARLQPRRNRVGNSLPRDSRLVQKAQYDRVYAARRRLELTYLSFHICPNEIGHSRLGLSVSRRVGRAVVRNRLRRRVRELFRSSAKLRGVGVDIVVHASKRGGQAHWEALVQEFARAEARFGHRCER